MEALYQMHVYTIDDVKRFFSLLSHPDTDLAWHPDTPFSDYVNIQTDQETFTLEQQNILQGLMNDAFDVCEAEGVDIYALCIESSKRN